MIDPNRQYRTRDGRAVRIYATDGGPHQIHGAVEAQPGWWEIRQWNDDGKHPYGPSCDLIEVTLADELRDQIPWEALRPEIQWVAMTPEAQWEGFSNAPWPTDLGWCFKPGRVWRIDALNMPDVDRAHWEQTLTQRPEGR